MPVGDNCSRSCHRHVTQRHVTGQDHQSTCEHDSGKLSKRQVRLFSVLLETLFFNKNSNIVCDQLIT